MIARMPVYCQDELHNKQAVCQYAATAQDLVRCESYIKLGNKTICKKHNSEGEKIGNVCSKIAIPAKYNWF